ncbi:MAG: hypothetical protein ACYC6Z_02290, partial [Thermoleophilia bacterium]
CWKGGKRKGKGSKEGTGTSKELIAEKRTFYFAEMRTNLVDVDNSGIGTSRGFQKDLESFRR